MLGRSARDGRGMKSKRRRKEMVNEGGKRETEEAGQGEIKKSKCMSWGKKKEE